MNQKTLITIAVVGGAGVLLYLYLRKSGKLDKWFPSAASNEFTDEAALLAYCMRQDLQALPPVTAVFIDTTGARHTAACADWLSAQQRSGGGQTAGLSAVNPAVDKNMLAILRQAAMGTLGQDLANVAQWNLMLRELDPQAAPLDGQGSMNAEQYLVRRMQGGLPQIAPLDETFTNPAGAWVN